MLFKGLKDFTRDLANSASSSYGALYYNLLKNRYEDVIPCKKFLKKFF
jgi:hypothetical protein